MIARDPFVSLDIEGVGELIQIAAERGRKTREKLKLGICGEHGGDPDFDPLLPRLGTGLCLLFAIPRANCASGGGASGLEKESQRRLIRVRTVQENPGFFRRQMTALSR